LYWDSNLIAEDLAGLVRRTAKANSALLNGDVSTYLTLISHAADYTLMAPFGGASTHGFDPSTEQLAELSRFFQSGEAELELVQAHASGDLAVLVLIERQRAAIGGLPTKTGRQRRSPEADPASVSSASGQRAADDRADEDADVGEQDQNRAGQAGHDAPYGCVEHRKHDPQCDGYDDCR
jgi:hypothetical protein